MAQSIGEVVEAHANDETNSVDRWILGSVAIEPATPGTVINDETLFDTQRLNNDTVETIARSPGASSDLAALAFSYNDGSQAPSGVTWDSVALTKVLEKTEGTWTLSIWILGAANSGSHDFQFSYASAVSGFTAALILKDVDGTTPTAGTASQSESAPNAAITQTITSGTLTDGVIFSAMGVNAHLVDMDVDSTGDVTAIHTVSGPETLEIEGSFQIADTKAPDTTGPGPRPAPPTEPPGGGGPIGEPGVGDPTIDEPRKPRERRGLRGLRGLRGRRGFKAGPIGSRLPPAEPGEQIDKSVPDEYEEKLVRKWLTFGWLTAPMLESQKTITLRDWGKTEGLWWQHGELFYAYDIPPVEGGKRLALLRVMQVPFIEFTASLKMADYHKLGYSWAMANNLTSPSGRTGLQVWEDLHSKPERLWLLRFQVERIFEQGRKERDTVQVGVPMPLRGSV